MSKGTKKEVKSSQGLTPDNKEVAVGAVTAHGDSGESPIDPTAELSYRQKRTREVFVSHTVDELYFTSDDQCFVSQQFAVLHAQGLGEQTVTPINRKEIE